MLPDYDREKVMSCMLDPVTSLMIAELEDGGKTCSYLAGAASIPEEDVMGHLSYMVECGFILRGTDSSGNVTFEADSARLSEAVEDGGSFDTAIDGLVKMDSYLN